MFMFLWCWLMLTWHERKQIFKHFNEFFIMIDDILRWFIFILDLYDLIN